MKLVVALLTACSIGLVVAGIPSKPRHLAARVFPYLGLARPTGDLRLLVSKVVQKMTPTRADEIALRLDSANWPMTSLEFRSEQAIWGFAGIAASGTFLALGALAGASIEAKTFPILAVLAFGCGWLARDKALTIRIARRRASIAQALPEGVELVTLILLSGESVLDAFRRVAGSRSDDLGDELRRIVNDVSSGEPLADALARFRRRADDPMADRLVSAIVTALERGSPLADILRAQADDARAAVRQRLIEAAGRREIAMLVPVVFLILPVVVVIALLPAFVSLKQVL